MENIRLLDCTLRDGGYINQWDFGEKTIKSIISRLIEAGTDIISEKLYLGKRQNLIFIHKGYEKDPAPKSRQYPVRGHDPP